MTSLPQLPKLYRSIISGAAIAVVLLVSQNLMGMYMNFWVNLSSFANMVDAFRTEGVLDAHIAVGLVIVIGTFLQVTFGVRSRQRNIRLAAASAFGFALLAFLSGLQFTLGGQSDIFSFSMEIGFVGIFGSIAVLLYLTGKSRGALKSES